MEEQVRKDEELARKLQQEECEAAGDLGKAVAASIADVQRQQSSSYMTAEKAVASSILPNPNVRPNENTSSQDTDVLKVISTPQHGVDPNKSPVLKSSRKSILLIILLLLILYLLLLLLLN